MYYYLAPYCKRTMFLGNIYNCFDLFNYSNFHIFPYSLANVREILIFNPVSIALNYISISQLWASPHWIFEQGSWASVYEIGQTITQEFLMAQRNLKLTHHLVNVLFIVVNNCEGFLKIFSDIIVYLLLWVSEGKEPFV